MLGAFKYVYRELSFGTFYWRGSSGDDATRYTKQPAGMLRISDEVEKERAQHGD